MADQRGSGCRTEGEKCLATPRGRQIVLMAATESPPYGSYAQIVAVFVGGLAAAGALERLLERDPRRSVRVLASASLPESTAPDFLLPRVVA